MTKIRLSILGGNVASSKTLSDAEQLKKISIKNMAGLLKWTVRRRVLSDIVTVERWREMCKKFGLKSEEELGGAYRFAANLFERGTEVTLSEIREDLQLLGFENGKIKVIVDNLESLWAETEDYLVRTREETIPVLTSLNWRIDIRHSSSDYLTKPEAVALLRIGVHDSWKRQQIYIELSKDRLSWLETTIGKVKRQLLKAEEVISQKDMTK